MKSTSTSPAQNRSSETKSRDRRRRLFLGIIVAFLALTPWTVGAGVIDDFDGAQPRWSGENNPSGAATFQLVDQQLLISADFKVATDPATLVNTFANVYYSTNLPVSQGQTLELRADLVSANQDNVFAFLGTMDARGGEYALVKDANEIGLLKWSATEGFSAAFWESRSLLNQGVVLVLSLTPIGQSLLIESEVVRKSDQQVLYRKSVLDGPGSDWPVPTPAPHGWQVLTPDAGAPYKDNLTVVWLAMVHQTDGQQGLAELRWDNLEYDTYPSPYLEIKGGATMLTWPEDTAQEQIVVGADSLTSSVWTPWPEPVYKRFGQCTMVIPATSPQMFGKLVPGTQSIDNFSPTKEPVATRNSWEPWFMDNADASKFAFTLGDGVLRIQALEQPVNGQVMVFFPGGGEIVKDFCASVDILDWGTSSQNSALGIAGRVQGSPDSGVSNMYLGSLQVNPTGYPGKGGLFFFNGAGNFDPPASEMFDLTPGTGYRLQFSVVGNQLTLRVLDLKKGGALAAPQRTLSASAFSEGRVALWVNTRGSSSYSRTVDNFFMTGTR